jgi:O-antigen/teichoic acid export membrane protein
MSPRVRDLARHTGVYGIGTVVGGIGRAALIPVVARFVPTDEYGKASVVFIFITLFSIVAEVGLSSSLIKFFSEARSEEERRRLVSTVVAASLMLSVPIAVVCILFAGNLSELLLGSPGHRLLILVGVAGGLGGALLQIGLAFERALARSYRYVAYTVLKGGLALVLSVTLVVAFGKGALGLLLGAALPPLLLGAIVYGRLIRRFAAGFSRSVFESVFRFGSPLVPMNLAMWVLAYSDIYLLRRLLPPARALPEVGLYQYAHEICLVLVLPVTSLNLAWPQFLFANYSEPAAPRTFARVHRYFAFFMLVMASLLAIFADWLIAVVGSPDYMGSSVVIPYLAGSLVFYGFSILFSSGLYIAGKTGTLAVVVAASAALNAGLNLVLIPGFGKEGAAAATLMANAVMATAILGFSQRGYRIPFDLRRTAGGLAIAFGLIGILVYLFGSVYATPLPVRLGAAAGLCVCLAAVFRMGPADLRAGLGIIASLFRRPSPTQPTA